MESEEGEARPALVFTPGGAWEEEKKLGGLAVSEPRGKGRRIERLDELQKAFTFLQSDASGSASEISLVGRFFSSPRRRNETCRGWRIMGG